MTSTPIARRIAAVSATFAPLNRFVAESSWAQQSGDEPACDFVFSNPSELPLPEYVATLQRWAVPGNKDWYSLALNSSRARAAVVESLQARHGLPFDPRDIFLTNGSVAAMSVALMSVVDPGDEVIFISPPWFFFETLIVGCGATPVRVKAEQHSFDLDLDAIGAAITERTRAVLINTPNNPTGRIYSPETLAGLARALSAASERIGRTIYVISDEAYSRIVFDGLTFHSPAEFYPSTFQIYTYSKTLLTPGQRLGYLAMPPTMPLATREQLREAIDAAQVVVGFAYPNALLQHALGDLEQLSIDIDSLQRRRDRLAGALREMGYQVHLPEGAFYLLPRSPWADDFAFTELLASYRVYCLPGEVVECPGYFRVSLTASDAMIEDSLAGFAAAIERARHA